MKILFIGDIVGKGGRKAVSALLPELKSTYAPDIVIANAENIAHGVGVTRKTLEEIQTAGVDAFTSGNHIWAKDEASILLEDKSLILLRPHNMPKGAGSGIRLVNVGAYQLLLINLQGQVFMREGTNNPFSVFDQIMEEAPEVKKAHAILLDFHAEATSEKVALGWHADGKVSCVVGTHTHVPTADARILTQGTGFVSDVGMTGPRDSVIGVDTNVIVQGFITGRNIGHIIPEKGPMVFNSVLIDIDPKTQKTTSITRVDRMVDIE